MMAATHYEPSYLYRDSHYKPEFRDFYTSKTSLVNSGSGVMLYDS